MNWEIKEVHLSKKQVQRTDGKFDTLYIVSLVKRKGEGDTIITEQTDKENTSWEFISGVIKGFMDA